MNNVPDPIIRKTISLPSSMWRQIEDFQFKNRVKRDAAAIRRLIELGLEAAKRASSEERPAESDVPAEPPAPAETDGSGIGPAE